MAKFLWGIFCGVVIGLGGIAAAEERSDFELSEALHALDVDKITMQIYSNTKWAEGVNGLIANSDGQIEDLRLIIEFYRDHFSGFKIGVPYPREAMVRLLQKNLAASIHFSGTFGGFSLIHLVFSGVDPETLTWILEHQAEVPIGLNGHGIAYVLENGKGRSLSEAARVMKSRNRFLEIYFLRVPKIPPQDLALALKHVVSDQDLVLAQILVDAGIHRGTMTPNPEDFYSVDPDTEVGTFLKAQYPKAYELFPDPPAPPLDGEACDTLLDR